MNHPEAADGNQIEPTIGEQLRFEEFKRTVQKLDNIEELREITVLLAKQAMVLQPSAIRYLAKEAAQNLCASSGSDWSQAVSEMKKHLLDQ